MIPDKLLKYLKSKFSAIFSKKEYRNILKTRSTLLLDIITPNNFRYRTLLGKNGENKWDIINLKKIEKSKYYSLAQTSTSVFKQRKVDTMSKEDARKAAYNMIDIIKNKVYKSEGYPAFREIFQNSLGAADFTDPEIQYGATKIHYILGDDTYTKEVEGKEEVYNWINSCMLIDNGVGMDLQIMEEEEDGNLYYMGTMGHYLWIPTFSGKRKGIRYTADIEKERISVDIPGYLGIGFMSFAAVWQKVAVLSKMKNNRFAFTINTNTNRLVFEAAEGADFFVGFTFDENISTKEELKNATCPIYTETGEESGLEITFYDLPEEAQSILLLLFEKYREELYKPISSKKEISQTSGTIIFGYKPYNKFMMDDGILKKPNSLISQIYQFTGYEKITGFSDKIKKITGHPRIIELTWMGDTLDITENNNYELFQQLGYHITEEEMLEVKYIKMNPDKKGLTKQQFENRKIEGNLLPDDYIIETKEMPFHVEAFIIPKERLSNPEFEYNVGEIIMLQNGIPVVPLHLVVREDEESKSYKLEDSFTQLTSHEETEENIFFTQDIIINSIFNYNNYKILLNCNWIAINMGRDGILRDFRYKYLKNFIEKLISKVNNQYLLEISDTKIREIYELISKKKYVSLFYAIFETRFNVLFACEKNITKKQLENWIYARIFPNMVNHLININSLLELKNNTLITIQTTDTTISDAVNIEKLHRDYNKAGATILVYGLKAQQFSNSPYHDILLLGKLISVLKEDFKKREIKFLIIAEKYTYTYSKIGFEVAKYLPINAKYVPTYEAVTKETIKDIEEKDPIEARFIRRVITDSDSIGKTILKYLIKLIQDIPNSLFFDLNEDRIRYTNLFEQKEEVIYLPTKIIGSNIDYDRIKNKFLDKQNPIKLELGQNVSIWTIAFYSPAKMKVVINKGNSFYNELLSIYKDKKITKSDKLNLIISLIINLLIHEIAHEPVIALLISAIYRQSLAHAFPEFADSITWMQNRLFKFYIDNYRYRKKSIKTEKKVIEKQKGLEQFMLSKINNTIDIFCANYNINYKCKNCQSILIPIDNKKYFCQKCKREINI